jgi:hypothetical protein
METTCISCRWCDTSRHGDPDEDWPYIVCEFPTNRLPTSMAGFANCERETVNYLNRPCLGG